MSSLFWLANFSLFCLIYEWISLFCSLISFIISWSLALLRSLSIYVTRSSSSSESLSSLSSVLSFLEILFSSFTFYVIFQSSKSSETLIHATIIIAKWSKPYFAATTSILAHFGSMGILLKRIPRSVISVGSRPPLRWDASSKLLNSEFSKISSISFFLFYIEKENKF